MIGQTVSHYRIREKIGEGGMGVVYRAEDERLKRPVALKFLPAHLVADTVARDRFLAEARTASALDHPNVCVVHEIDELPSGEVFIAMAFYDGETLEGRIADGPMAVDDALAMACQLAEGLSAAHRAGIVHRDVKPANVIVTWDGTLKILDFGIAKLAGAAGSTKTGTAVGTVAYAAPEQLDTGEATPRSDVWSAGVVLYEMLAGRLPFAGTTPMALLHQVLLGEPRPLREVRPDVPDELAAAIDGSLSRDPTLRPADAEALLALLRKTSGSTSSPLPTASPSLAADSWSAPHFLTPEASEAEVRDEAFVGRERELRQLQGWLNGASAGQGRFAFVRGEAGSGKTALAREFSRRAALEDADLTLAIGACNAYTGPGDPYRPFREILGQLTGDVEAQWAGGGLAASQAARLWHLLPEASEALLEGGPHLVGTFLAGTGLLRHGRAHGGVSGEVLLELEKLEATAEMATQPPPGQTDLCGEYVRVIRHLARDRTLLLIIDDLQWADTASVQLLFEIARHLAGTRLMLLGLYRTSEVALGRDGQRHPLEPLLNDVGSRWGNVCTELGDAGDRSFIDAVIDAEPNVVGDDFRSSLLRHAGGNALFTVELYRGLRDAGLVTKDAVGRWSTAGEPIDWSQLPARVEAAIAERLARLDPGLQRLLALASVEGERFTLEVLAHMEGADPRDLLRAVNHDLQKRHRLIVPEGLRQVNGRRLSTYRFRHILFQRHLYDGLDVVERSYLHEQVAESLEALHGDHAKLIALPLAHHYRKAGRIENACEHLKVAGISARNSLAHNETLTHFETALDLTLALPPSEDRDRRELTLQTLVGETRIALAAPGIAEAYGRALELADAVGTPEQVFRASGGLYGLHHYAGYWKEPLALGEHCLSIARKEGDQRLLAAGLLIAAHAALYSADFEKAAGYCRELLSFYDPERHASALFFGGVEIGASARFLLGSALLRRGYIDQGYAVHDQAAETARSRDDRLALHIVHFFAARDLTATEDFAGARDRVDACLALQKEIGAHGFLATIPHLVRGWCDVHLGDPEGGLSQIERGLAGWPYQGFRAVFLGELAVAQCRCTGRVDCLSELEASLAVPEENGPLYRGRALRLFGDVLSTLPEPTLDRAEEAYRGAIEVCEAHGDRVDALNASVALAKLLADTDRQGEGHRALRKAYGAFSEGHTSPLLRRAQKTLAALSSEAS